MQCGDVGALQAYLDAELIAPEMEEVRRHLAECARCRDELAELREAAATVAAHLSPGTAERAPAAGPALARLQARMARDGEQRRSPGGLLAQWARAVGPRWSAVGAAVAVLIAVLAFGPVHLEAESFFSIFRIQKFAAVTVDPSMFPGGMPSPGMAGMPHDLSSAAKLKGSAEAYIREVTPAEAAKAVDFPMRQPQNLPAQFAGQSRTFVTKSVAFTETVDLGQIQAALDQAGAKDVQLTPSLDGATLRASIPASIVTLYGAAATIDPEQGANRPTQPYLIFGQSRGPSLEIPDSVDVEALRTEVLALPMIPAELAAQLRAIKDWRHTLVIPVPAGTHKDVTVAGAPGLLISHPDQTNTLLWQKGDVVYALSGTATESELQRIANSLR